MAGIFLLLTIKHTFDIITNIERKFELRLFKAIYRIGSTMDCKTNI